MSLKIKFSHYYPKVWKQKAGILLHVRVIDSLDVSPALKEYDTKHGDGYYELPKNKLIQLIFLGDKGIPFCTLRRHTDEKFEYYVENMNKAFRVEVLDADSDK